MLDVVNTHNKVKKSGAIIKDGTITPYTHVDLTDFIDDLKTYKEDYKHNKPKNMHHIASIPFDVIEHIRLEKKFPRGQDGWKLALNEAISRVQSGELGVFKVHGD